MSGFSDDVRRLVLRRAGGRCERCRLTDTGYEYHHRRPRGMGGSKAPDTNAVTNCLLLCGHCHRAVEAGRAEALQRGYLVSQALDPARVPVWRLTGWVLLTGEGGLVPVTRRGGG